MSHPRAVALAAALAMLVFGAPALAQVPEAAGTWQALAPLPQPRSEVSMATDGSRLYLAGGFGGPGSSPRELFAYDPAADSWQVLTQLPVGANHAPLVHHDGRLYLVGGFREASFEPTDALWIYSLDAGTWQEGPPMPTARGGHAVAVHEGRLHAIGGVGSGGQTGAHEVFDPATNAWSRAADLPTPRDHLGVARLEDEIVVLAGRNGTTFSLTTNEIYDPGTDSWRQGAPVPTGRSGVAAVPLGGYVYLFGGEVFGPDRTFDEVERYHPASDTWEKLPAMPTARHGLGAAAIGNAIHVVAGGPDAGLSVSDVHERLTPE